LGGGTVVDEERGSWKLHPADPLRWGMEGNPHIGSLPEKCGFHTPLYEWRMIRPAFVLSGVQGDVVTQSVLFVDT